MNNITILGRLGQDPETIQTNNGKTLVKFSVATNDGFGEHKKTNWHNCIVFGKRAETIAQYFQKGSNICLSGSVDYSNYEKDGQKKYFTQILVNDFSFVDSKTEKAQQSQTESTDLNNDEDDELPY